MSLHDDRRFVAAMRAAGASGYLRKDRVHEELAHALRVVAAGGSGWGRRRGSSRLKGRLEGDSTLGPPRGSGRTPWICAPIE